MTSDTSKRWMVGHNELVWPMLLHHNPFTITEIGGKGRFTPPGIKDSFCTESESTSNGALERRTMRYRRLWRVGQEKNKLYHPVKPLSFVMREKIDSRKCQVAAGTLGRADMGRVLASTLTRLATIRVTMCDLLSTPVGPYRANGAEDSCSSCPSGPKKQQHGEPI